MPNSKRNGRYPNSLRSARLAACLTRAQLSERTMSLAAKDPSSFTAVSEASIKALELGWSRPRPRTAATVSHSLGAEPLTLFTSGIDDGNRRQQV